MKLPTQKSSRHPEDPDQWWWPNFQDTSNTTVLPHDSGLLIGRSNVPPAALLDLTEFKARYAASPERLFNELHETQSELLSRVSVSGSDAGAKASSLNPRSSVGVDQMPSSSPSPGRANNGENEDGEEKQKYNVKDEMSHVLRVPSLPPSPPRAPEAPTPPIFSDTDTAGDTHRFANWAFLVRWKIRTERARFDTAESRLAYLVGLTEGKVQDTLVARLRSSFSSSSSSSSCPITDVDEALDYLGLVYGGPGRAETERKFQALQMGSSQSVRQFLKRFVPLAVESGVPETAWTNYLFEKVTGDVQKVVGGKASRMEGDFRGFVEDCVGYVKK